MLLRQPLAGPNPLPFSSFKLLVLAPFYRGLFTVKSIQIKTVLLISMEI